MFCFFFLEIGYLHRIIAETMWNMGGQSVNQEQMLTHLYKALEAGGEALPSIDEIKARLPRQKQEVD